MNFLEGELLVQMIHIVNFDRFLLIPSKSIVPPYTLTISNISNVFFILYHHISILSCNNKSNTLKCRKNPIIDMILTNFFSWSRMVAIVF